VNKKMILDQLKKRDYLKGIESSELAVFGRIFDRIREHDYDGLMQSARKHGLDLGSVFKVFEDKAAAYLKAGTRLRSYELCVLEKMFSDPEKSKEAGQKGVIQPLEKEKIRELYFLLSAPRFGERQLIKLKYNIEQWGLKWLEEYFWQKGLSSYFNERYHKLADLVDQEYSIEEIIKKASLPELLEEKKLVEDFVFDETGGSKHQDGIKEDLIQEQRSREKALEILERLYAVFNQSQIDFAQARRLMLELHMQRRVEIIEKNGIQLLRERLRNNWLSGAREIARRYDFIVPQIMDEADSDQALQIVNKSFLNQARQSKQGKVFLHRETILAQTDTVQDAHCYRLETGYLLLVVTPFEEEEHFIFGLCPSRREQSALFTNFLEKYFRTDSFRKAASLLIQHYLQVHSGQIRLRNAIKIASFAFPVVITVALLVGWLYKLTIGNPVEALMLGGVLVFIGEAIAARNGYSQKIRPEDHDQIPDYACREKGVLKFKPVEINELPEEK